MTASGWFQIGVFLLLVTVLTRPTGRWLHRVFNTAAPLGPLGGKVESAILRVCGAPSGEQDWKEYARSLLWFSAAGVLVTYGVQRLQGTLPLNPQGLAAVEPALAFNTAVSFVTNTNWQSYAGESTLGYLVQMSVLTWNNFISAAVGMGVALALARGLTRRVEPGAASTLGNFWLDVVRGLLWVLLPGSLVAALVLVSQGVVQNFAAYLEVTTLEGKQVLAMGPVASQEAIKMLGTNGGGFFNANSAHPFENPTPLTNLLQMLLIFLLPAGLTHTYGLMARNTRQGWALFSSMMVLCVAGVLCLYAAESQPGSALRNIGMDESAGNMEGKEVRFGISQSALFATVTTDASCGAVNAMHDSFTPLGGLVPLVNMQLGEVVFGGLGAGLYGMLMMVLLAVFLAGLMVGRTPEYLGKKIEPREMKLITLFILVSPLVILLPTGFAAVFPDALSSLNNAGPHGLSEILYAFTSGAANNGSAFAGLNANTPFFNVALALGMFFGRFWLIVPVLAVAGSMVGKKTVPPGPGTFPTDGALFVVLLTGVILVVGALTFFPALSLSPVLEHFVGRTGKGF